MSELTDSDTFDAAAELEALSALTTRAATLAADDRQLERRRAGVSAWSVAQQIEHVLRATRHSLAAALLLHRGGDDRIHDTPRRERSGAVVLRSGRIPRGGTQAPAHVRPEDAPDAGSIQAELANVEGLIERLRAVAPELAAARGALAHPLLGDFDAVEWVRFTRVHADHHMQIVDEILAP